MSTYALNGSDVATLNEASELAEAQAKAAARECGKAFLGDAKRIAEKMGAASAEARQFLTKMSGGKVDLGTGHIDALGAGLQLLYLAVSKDRARALHLSVNPEAFDVRKQEIRDTVRRLRVNLQLDALDEQANAEEAAARAGDAPASRQTEVFKEPGAKGTPAREPKRHARGRAAAAPTIEA